MGDFHYVLNRLEFFAGELGWHGALRVISAVHLVNGDSTVVFPFGPTVGASPATRFAAPEGVPMRGLREPEEFSFHLDCPLQ